MAKLPKKVLDEINEVMIDINENMDKLCSSEVPLDEKLMIKSIIEFDLGWIKDLVADNRSDNRRS